MHSIHNGHKTRTIFSETYSRKDHVARDQLKQAIFIFAGALVALSACSQNRAPQTIPASQPNHEAVQEVLHEGWTPIRATGTTEYLIKDSTTIVISNDSTHTVPIQTSTLYSVRFVSIGDSFTLVGKVDSVKTSTQSHASRNTTDMVGRQEFQAMVGRYGKISVLSENFPSSCGGGIESAATRLFDLTLELTATERRVGDRWTDTVSAMICRGKTLLTQQTIRQYELLGLEKWKEQNAVKISRNSTSIFSTTSMDPKSHLTTSGSGSSSTTIYADKTTGQLLQSDGRSQSTLSVSTNRGVYPFTQIVDTHIEIR
jgi:hypothetical protein